MIKHIIFDLDGTIFDTSEGILKSIKHTLNFLEIKLPSEELLKKFIGPPIEKSFEEIMNFSKNQAREAAVIFRKVYPRLYLLDAFIYNGFEKMIDEFRKKNIVLSVATYKRESYTLKLLNHFNLYDKFDFVFGSDNEGKLIKTDIVNMCIIKSGVNKEETIMVGDTIHDLLAAKMLNIGFIAVTYGFGFKTEKDVSGYDCIAVCNNVDELYLNILKEQK